MKASKKKSKSLKRWEKALAELRDAKDRDGLLAKLLTAAACHLQAVQVFAVRPEELRGFMALEQDQLEREAVRSRVLTTSQSSLAVTTAQTGILNLGPVPESEPALALLPPGANAKHGLVFLPIALKQRTVFLLMGAPKDKIKPDLRTQMDQLSQEAAVALAEIILQAKGKRPSGEIKPLAAQAKAPVQKPAQTKTPARRPVTPVLVKGPTTERAQELARAEATQEPAADPTPAPAAAAAKSKPAKSKPAKSKPTKSKPTATPAQKHKAPEPQIAAINTEMLDELDWDLDPDLLNEK